jgi:DNA repair protein RadC
MAITDWQAGERPREKLMQKGAEQLSDAELLAMFLRLGVVGKSTVDLARDLVVRFGSLNAILVSTPRRLMPCMAWGGVNISNYKLFLR